MFKKSFNYLVLSLFSSLFAACISGYWIQADVIKVDRFPVTQIEGTISGGTYSDESIFAVVHSVNDAYMKATFQNRSGKKMTVFWNDARLESKDGCTWEVHSQRQQPTIEGSSVIESKERAVFTLFPISPNGCLPKRSRSGVQPSLLPTMNEDMVYILRVPIGVDTWRFRYRFFIKIKKRNKYEKVESLQ